MASRINDQNHFCDLETIARFIHAHPYENSCTYTLLRECGVSRSPVDRLAVILHGIATTQKPRVYPATREGARRDRSSLCMNRVPLVNDTVDGTISKGDVNWEEGSRVV